LVELYYLSVIPGLFLTTQNKVEFKPVTRFACGEKKCAVFSPQIYIRPTNLTNSTFLRCGEKSAGNYGLSDETIKKSYIKNSMLAPDWYGFFR